jgi:hypothetical protein
MKTFLKNLVGTAAALVAALVLTVGFNEAAKAQYVGYNPATGIAGYNGLEQAVGGPSPTTTGSTCASGTLTVTGTGTGKVATTTCTTLVLILTWTIPALGPGAVAGSAGSGYSQAVFAPVVNGAYCTANDVTHPAALTQNGAATYTAPTATAAGTIVCTFSSATITASDVIYYNVVLF